MSTTTDTWPPKPPCWATGWLAENDLATDAGRRAFDGLPAGEQMQVAFLLKQRERAAQAGQR